MVKSKNKNKKTISNMIYIWHYLNPNIKIRLLIVLISMLITSIAEMVSLALVIPVLTIISNPNKIWDIYFAKEISNLFAIDNSQELVNPFIFLFIFAVLISGLIRLFNLYLTSNTSAIIGEYLTTKAIKNVMNLPYQMHKNLNSSEVITAITSFSNSLVESINEYLRIFTSTFIVLGLILSLVLIDWKFAILTISIFTFIYIALYLLFKNKLKEINFIMESISKNQVKILQESLEAIRDIIIDSKQNLIINEYRNRNRKFRFANADLRFIQLSPRIIVDSIAISIICFLAVIISNSQSNTLNTITLLGIVAYMSQRILPSLQQIFSGISFLSSTQMEVNNILSYMDLERFREKKYSKNLKIKFKDEIILRNITFRYPNSKSNILKNLNLTIKKGQKIGIIGKSGCGKTTLLDILMGLLYPIEGNFIVDGKDLMKGNLDRNFSLWRSIISHVPQNIFLADASINRNIAFSDRKDNININLVKESASMAMLSKFIDELPEKYKTTFGERGAKLSGGQRQRIGLARAFYKKSEILFLDEATNSLDMDTQSNVLKSIESLSKEVTVFMVAHRKETLINCDKIYML